MAKPRDGDQVVYVRLPLVMIQKIDRRVKREQKERSDEIDAKAISRSSVIRSAVSKMLDQDGGT